MNTKQSKLIFSFLFLLTTTQAFAELASIKITSPMEGEKLANTENNKIVFEANPGPKGDHLHLYVDDSAPVILHQLKGDYVLKKLEIGNRNICLKLVDKNHTPVGVEKCIRVSVK